MILDAVLSMTDLFKRHRVEYCVIGGLAMLMHNGRANTVDIDFYVIVDDLKAVKALLESENISVQSRGEYQLKAKVGTIPIDILYADHYIGRDVVYRAIDKPLGKHLVRIATPEDLIVLKTIANRSVDRRDIEELRELFGKRLDEAYIAEKINYLKKEMES